MSWVSKTVNGFLGQLGLHVSRTSSFEGLRSELARTTEALETIRQTQDHEGLLGLSQRRWRGDEPDAGLTWGVPMVGDEFVQFLLSHVTLRDNSTIVEIGPGYGRILNALLKEGVPFRRYIGIDISAARVERLREKYRDPRIEFREGDILSKFELNAVADLTVSSAVFEHLYPDFGAAVDTISQFTKPGGATVIDFIRTDEKIETTAAFFERETYMRIYSLHELHAFFGKNGFKVKDVGKVSFGRDVLNREITRTIVFATNGEPGPSLESLEVSTGQKSVEVSPYDTFVQRPLEPIDEDTLEPPVQPAFRSHFGGLWTDLNTADAILSGKLAIGELLPEEARLVEAWRRNGFVILPGAVSHAAIDAALVDLERAYDGELQRKMRYWGDSDGLHIVDASREHLRKNDSKLLDLHDVSDAVQAIVFAEPIGRFLQIIFERPALAFQSLGFYYGSQQGLHQDSAFVRVSSPLEMVASWIALEDIHPGSGELEYYPGSHALPHFLFSGKHLWADPKNPEVLQFTDVLHDTAKKAGLSARRFTAKKGDVLIWAAGLMHGGSPVTDPNLTRKSIVTHYCPADLQPMYAYKGGRTKRKSVSGHYVTALEY